MAGTSPIGAKMERENSLPPCGGGLGRGVERAYPASWRGPEFREFSATPLPGPPPQGGRESSALRE